MKKISFILSIIFIASLASCSRSGNRPTGPKTITKGIVISTKEAHGKSLKFLFDLNLDGIPDGEEWLRSTTNHPNPKDTIYIVKQGGHIVEWYK